MNINDPFGRLARRHQLGYEAVRDSMVRNNINTPEAARGIIKDTKKRALKFSAALVVIALLTYLLLPRSIIIVGGAAVVIGWVINWTINAERYISRYIEEELSGR